ncbi:membralin-like protein At1g60995 isoform X2 [Impatiens glandulifera]|uniref:membralin-like protein At1g60995 isoform X2 n=1 Tax=Impatiens glandulifera TaxID=253017 RepID=UPI001FB0F06F|nr:membralin-like protein At1g60995 isoform X2 [Impatiens glandulifera]
MDPEQTFIRVQERFSQMLTPRIRASLEYIFLFLAITLFCILVVMHANYVQQPGCSSELSEIERAEAQLFHIKITSAGLWSHNEPESDDLDVSRKGASDKIVEFEIVGDGFGISDANVWWSLVNNVAMRINLLFKFWQIDNPLLEIQQEVSSVNVNSETNADAIKSNNWESVIKFSISVKVSLKTAMVHIWRKWHGRFSILWRHARRILGGLWDIAGIHLNIDVPKWLHILHLENFNSYAVQWLEKRSKTSEPSYLFTMEKGYHMLPEEVRISHNIQTVNISISAWHSCFGNRWQQLLINRLVGYDTILMNSLLSSPGQGYIFNYQSNEYYNLTYAHEQPEGSAQFGDYLVTKCAVLMMSLFVFFTTTMSVSFTLRETQTRMLKFTVQLQHHARHRLPTFQLIFVHVIESLVFVPIMIGILFFLFEFYDDQLLAFMVLILVWLCELFTLISVRTPISMKFFPRFFLLYFLAFHIYFFSYTSGFSYLALSTTAAFMQHLILYFWNRFEVPALQRFMQNRRSQFQQHPDFHITSSTILASTLHITRLNTRTLNPPTTNMDHHLHPILPPRAASTATAAPVPTTTTTLPELLSGIQGPPPPPERSSNNNNNTNIIEI